ncbi:hypothetical protein GCM10007385_26680 [Tateyamaria omphalii]|uniref:DUF4240 domain-containing protein n=1 Tax=Tateyamaria omphalii TaxID=299262 RepID=UPI001674DD1D|nr:DUF4240 domain-containing protein [Tateyamaria omphalii]GGX56575.1 hypothetical protein GCM10007385_26680 [Tateyamaria omphalii]
MRNLPAPKFWSLINSIEGSGWNDRSTDLSPLINRLQSCDDNTIFGFEEALTAKLYAIDTYAHYRKLIWQPGSADPFLYKRLAIVAQGQAFYERFAARPFWTRRWPTDWLEGLLYVASDAYEGKHGTEMDFSPTLPKESFSNLDGWSNRNRKQ